MQRRESVPHFQGVPVPLWILLLLLQLDFLYPSKFFHSRFLAPEPQKLHMGFLELPQDSQSGPWRESTSLLCSLAWRDRSEPPGNQFIVFHGERGRGWCCSPLVQKEGDSSGLSLPFSLATHAMPFLTTLSCYSIFQSSLFQSSAYNQVKVYASSPPHPPPHLPVL